MRELSTGEIVATEEGITVVRAEDTYWAWKHGYPSITVNGTDCKNEFEYQLKQLQKLVRQGGEVM